MGPISLDRDLRPVQDRPAADGRRGGWGGHWPELAGRMVAGGRRMACADPTGCAIWRTGWAQRRADGCGRK